MKSITYCGPFDAVEIEIAPLMRKTVANGESVDVADRVAESLLEQTENWSVAAKTTPTTKSAKEA